jgi:hypothetical protein
MYTLLHVKLTFFFQIVIKREYVEIIRSIAVRHNTLIFDIQITVRRGIFL